MVIVAAVDATDHASRIVREADALADRFGDELHVLHVLPKSDYEDLVQDYAIGWDSVESEDVDALGREVVTRATDGVIDDYEAVTIVGDVAEEILAYADEKDARYVVLGGRKRSPVGKVVFGSVTQSVLLGADRPVVLVMRDEGAD